MSIAKRPLQPEFPVNVEGKKIKKQDGAPIANTDDQAVAADVAERLKFKPAAFDAAAQGPAAYYGGELIRLAKLCARHSMVSIRSSLRSR